MVDRWLVRIEIKKKLMMKQAPSISFQILRQTLNPAVVMTVSAFFLVAAIALSFSAQNAQDQGDWFTALLFVNAVGVVVLLIFLLASFIRLVRQYRKRVLGSRLMVRFVFLFMCLTIIPISVVYYFSAQFLSKGVDSWFDDKIEQALDDALLLGQGFLEASKQDLINNALIDSKRISSIIGNAEVVRALDQIRAERAYTELDLFQQNGRAVAFSHINAVKLFPNAPDKIDMLKASNGEVVVKIEQAANAALQYRILHPIVEISFNPRSRVLQIIQPLPLRYSRLGKSIEQASSEYRRLAYLRKPIKVSFLLTLSLITLMSTLISIWLALYAARRLVAPINDLATGTRAVASGDYSTQLKVQGDDEFGTLVSSFNTMIRKVRHAQNDAASLHLKEQTHRAYLQSVLSNLSSGVLSFDLDLKLQTHNARASDILGLALSDYKLSNIDDLCLEHSELKHFCDHLNSVMKSGQTGEKEIELEFTQGKQILIVRISALSEDDQRTHGWVVVFDDVTSLVHAQRDAAWGEVARRLAHEIKNPLTPIGLSAERIRHKYLKILPEDQREALDRSTRTIAEQVQTLKRMVDAFSNYARSERLELGQLDLNNLIEDVVDLYRQPDNTVEFTLNLDSTLKPMLLDQDGIRQILNNLIGNASDALEGKQHAQIELITKIQFQREQEGVLIQVKDNGDGFEDKIIKQVFEPYVTSKQKGTGLGMAIVKRIAQAHGGFVSATNRDNVETSGASVKVWLPKTLK